VRQAFLAAHPTLPVPGYSLPAVSDRAHTSKGLQESWRLMSVLSPRQDSQLAYDDAILPGSTVLGLRAPITSPWRYRLRKPAMPPFAHGRSGPLPRAALLESMIRFVVSDLEAK